MNFLRREKGFTLIELMVAVLIISVLVLVAIPRFVRTARYSRTQTCRHNTRIIQRAAQTYQMYNSSDPAAVGDLVPGYLKDVPGCPINASHAYTFAGDSLADPPLDVVVDCGNGGARDGVNDPDHLVP